MGRGGFAAVGAVLALMAVGVGVAGYLALRSHDASAAIARNDAAALAAAKDCVAATHAPDASAMSASQMKIIDCATGAFGTQATLYSGVLVDAYQAANVKVQVSDLRAAVEKNNPDGSIDVLVAVRTKISNSDTEGKEQGYRLRVQMVSVDGQYKVAKLDQVSS
jgi:Mce-associated membrane protein